MRCVQGCARQGSCQSPPLKGQYQPTAHSFMAKRRMPWPTGPSQTCAHWLDLHPGPWTYCRIPTPPPPAHSPQRTAPAARPPAAPAGRLPYAGCAPCRTPYRPPQSRRPADLRQGCVQRVRCSWPMQEDMCLPATPASQESLLPLPSGTIQTVHLKVTACTQGAPAAPPMCPSHLVHRQPVCAAPTPCRINSKANPP